MGEPAVDEEKGHLRSASAVVAQGKYRLFATLGRGGMAEVYLGVAQGPMGFNKLVVVKRLRSGLAQEPGFLAMFLDEARLAARLNHPNVVQTYEVGEEDGTFFLANTTVTEKELGAKLTAILSGLDDKGVFLRADKSANYGSVVKALAAARLAGATKLGMVTEPES